VIEKSLTEAVDEGRAEYALPWYLERHKKSSTEKYSRKIEDFTRFPFRLLRHYCF